MKNENRKITRKVFAGSLAIGGDAPVSIQSMTNFPIEDVKGTIGQIQAMYVKGADLARVAVKNMNSIEYLKAIVKESPIPISADVHFDYRIAIKAIESGIHKVRINPGNIGDEKRVLEIIKAAKDYNVAIRIGVNGGSLDSKKYNNITPEAIVSSAIDHIKILEDNDFTNIVVSLKSSHIDQTIESNRIFSSKKNYPLHVGLTEAGYGLSCIVNSSIAIGTLLMEGIGDTIRVSMTGDPVEEIDIAKKILQASGRRLTPIKIIACPTCGRTDISLDILNLAQKVEKQVTAEFESTLKEKNKSLTIAIMGCEVNGPGEAKDADIGVAGIREGKLLLFSKGQKIATIDKSEVIDVILKEVRKRMV